MKDPRDTVAPATERASIAIIDDNQVNLMLLSHLLARDRNLDTTTFLSPVDGLAHCLSHPIDLVLIDYMMPEMNGIEVIERLRDNDATRETPILMITTNDARAVRRAALEAGASDFLSKPIDDKELFCRVRNMLKLRAAFKREEGRANQLAEEVRLATESIHAREQELTYRIARAAEFRDPETGHHVQRVGRYSRLIAARLGLPAADQDVILAAAPLHDVGKIAISDTILLKPGKLTDSELEVMRGHARHGYNLLADSNASILQVGATIALTHHEKFDGSGYPDRLAGEAIPLIGRIVAVADVFDALISTRPYKTGWPIEKARAYVFEQRGRHFDPHVADAFLTAWDEVMTIYHELRDEVVPEH